MSEAGLVAVQLVVPKTFGLDDPCVVQDRCCKWWQPHTTQLPRVHQGYKSMRQHETALHEICFRVVYDWPSVSGIWVLKVLLSTQYHVFSCCSEGMFSRPSQALNWSRIVPIALLCSPLGATNMKKCHKEHLSRATPLRHLAQPGLASGVLSCTARAHRAKHQFHKPSFETMWSVVQKVCPWSETLKKAPCEETCTVRLRWIDATLTIRSFVSCLPVKSRFPKGWYRILHRKGMKWVTAW